MAQKLKKAESFDGRGELRHITGDATEELKGGPFKPEHAGKMNFYLSAVDAKLRKPGDNPSIGLLLCKEKDRLTVEYALQDVKKPIGVSQWKTRFVESLPSNLKQALPSITKLEMELGNKN